ncbi:MAG: GNAT family N-acetyltransferase [Pseudomonadota bacterium]
MSAPTGPLAIQTLRDRPDLLPTVASWHWNTWGRPGAGITLAEQSSKLRTAYLDDDPDWEMCWVAVANGAPAGTASLVADDGLGPPWDTVGPWLASVFVLPEHRGRWIASALIQYVGDMARLADFRELFLYTPDQQSLYRRHGYVDIARARGQQAEVDVMRTAL